MKKNTVRHHRSLMTIPRLRRRRIVYIVETPRAVFVQLGIPYTRTRRVGYLTFFVTSFYKI